MEVAEASPLPKTSGHSRFRPDWLPLETAAYSTHPCALTIVKNVEGPSYRPVGALMTVKASGGRIGSLSSGCVEADIERHAIDALKDGQTRTVRYGRGSPYIDITLPCGGGLEILIVPSPDQALLRTAVEVLKQRQPVCLSICPESGQMSLTRDCERIGEIDTFFLQLKPDLQFLIFGKGPEVVDFASLSFATGYGTKVFSPDTETLQACSFLEDAPIELRRKALPPLARGDLWTAAVMFFHDHDWEPELLRDLLKLDLYYIGAQGSKNARLQREQALEELGVNRKGIARIHGPIGLIPSARDSRTLAISVLSEVVALAP